MFCISVLLAFSMQLPTYDARDDVNLVLVCQFAKIEGDRGAAVVRSNDLFGIIISGSDDDRNKFLDRFSGQFGYDIRKLDSKGRIVMPFSRFVLDESPPEDADDVCASFRSDSLMGKGLRTVVSSGMKIRSLTYYYRPYLDSKLHRMEAVDISVSIISNKGPAVLHTLVPNTR